MISKWGWDGERGGGGRGGSGEKERGVSSSPRFQQMDRCSSLSSTFPQCAVCLFDLFPAVCSLRCKSTCAVITQQGCR